MIVGEFLSSQEEIKFPIILRHPWTSWLLEEVVLAEIVRGAWNICWLSASSMQIMSHEVAHSVLEAALGTLIVLPVPEYIDQYTLPHKSMMDVSFFFSKL